MTFKKVTNCDDFCGMDQCVGKVFYSTFLDVGTSQCYRTTDPVPEDAECSVKREAMVQSTNR